MGTTSSAVKCDESKAKACNDEINNQIKQDRVAAKNDVHILLLGTNESSKAFLLKQMGLVHRGGYSDPERMSYKKVVFSNVAQSTRRILEMMPQLDFAVRPQHDTKRSLILSHLAHLEDEHPSGSLVDALCGLSRDPPVQAAIAQSELQLDDVSYYLNVIDRIYDPEYLPSDQEILRCQNSSGITETMLQIGGLTYRLLDVRGTGSMRKWLPCFADVSALVFVAPIDQYDETLPHDPDINRLQDALTLFDATCNSRWFVNRPVILLLDGIDVFAEKLPRRPLEDHFPDYTGGQDYDAACDYILRRFVSLNKYSPTKQIYVHYTCVRDTQQIKFILSKIQDIILSTRIHGCFCS